MHNQYIIHIQADAVNLALTGVSIYTHGKIQHSARIQAGSLMSGSRVSKYGCVLSSRGTRGSVRADWLRPSCLIHLHQVRWPLTGRQNWPFTGWFNWPQ